MGNFFGITGTPGTGKKTIAPLVASKLGLPCISLYGQAVSSGLVKQGDNDAEVDTAVLGRFIVKHVSGSALFYGHLLPYVLGGRELKRVVVLRCEPKTLKRRLLARGYQPNKAVENIEAELIGVLSADSMSVFGSRRTAEFDTTVSKPGEAARVISELLKGSREPGSRIDWTLSYTSASKLRSLLSGLTAGAAQ
ncbi:MAG: AAA family ATPase [Nitrososphaerales archaeon]